jgi:hypothetical protein
MKVVSVHSVLADGNQEPPPESASKQGLADLCTRPRAHSRVTDDPFEGYEDLIVTGFEEWLFDWHRARNRSVSYNLAAGSLPGGHARVSDGKTSLDSVGNASTALSIFSDLSNGTADTRSSNASLTSSDCHAPATDELAASRRGRLLAALQPATDELTASHRGPLLAALQPATDELRASRRGPLLAASQPATDELTPRRRGRLLAALQVTPPPATPCFGKGEQTVRQEQLQQQQQQHKQHNLLGGSLMPADITMPQQRLWRTKSLGC